MIPLCLREVAVVSPYHTRSPVDAQPTLGHEPRRHTLVYLTYNGIYNFTNGIGTQTQLFLATLERLRPTLEHAYGPLGLHIVCPQPDADTWGYDAAFQQQQEQRVQALGGQVHYLPYKTQPATDLWAVSTWHALCAAAARLIAPLVTDETRCLLIPIDQPWLHTPTYLAQMAPEVFRRVQALLVLYSTAFIRQPTAPDADERRWEHDGLALAHTASNVAIADLCPSFSTHLREAYHLQEATFAPYTSSILPDDAVFTPLTTDEVHATMLRYGVPCDRDLVLAFGRATPLKGFDRLIPALEAVRERCHLALISVPYVGEPYQATYDRLIAAHGLAATHIRAFTRALPRALCQWPRTRMVVVPSQHETFSNIPLEVALWARHHGPVVVASRVGGFLDQIEDGVTGFFLDQTSSPAMGQTVQRVLEVPATAHARIRQQAYTRVMQRYDVRRTFPATLAWFWGTPAPAP